MTCIIHTPVGDAATFETIEQVHTRLNQAKRDGLVARLETSEGGVLVDPSTAVVSYSSLRPNIRVEDLAEPIRRVERDVGELEDDELLDELASRLHHYDGEGDLLSRAQAVVPGLPHGEPDDDALVALLSQRLHGDDGPALSARIASEIPDEFDVSAAIAPTDALLDALHDRLQRPERLPGDERLEDRIRALLPPTEGDTGATADAAATPAGITAGEATVEDAGPPSYTGGSDPAPAPVDDPAAAAPASDEPPAEAPAPADPPPAS